MRMMCSAIVCGRPDDIRTIAARDASRATPSLPPRAVVMKPNKRSHDRTDVGQLVESY